MTGSTKASTIPALVPGSLNFRRFAVVACVGALCGLGQPRGVEEREVTFLPGHKARRVGRLAAASGRGACQPEEDFAIRRNDRIWVRGTEIATRRRRLSAQGVAYNLAISTPRSPIVI